MFNLLKDILGNNLTNVLTALANAYIGIIKVEREEKFIKVELNSTLEEVSWCDNIWFHPDDGAMGFIEALKKYFLYEFDITDNFNYDMKVSENQTLSCKNWDTFEESLVNFMNVLDEMLENAFDVADVSGDSENTSKVREAIYELYKADWIFNHSTADNYCAVFNSYRKYIADTENDVISLCEFVEKYGFNGSIYASYDEFMDNEYCDKDFIEYIVPRDSELFKEWLRDIDENKEEEE